MLASGRAYSRVGVAHSQSGRTKNAGDWAPRASNQQNSREVVEHVDSEHSGNGALLRRLGVGDDGETALQSSHVRSEGRAVPVRVLRDCACEPQRSWGSFKTRLYIRDGIFQTAAHSGGRAGCHSCTAATGASWKGTRSKHVPPRDASKQHRERLLTRRSSTGLSTRDPLPRHSAPCARCQLLAQPSRRLTLSHTTAAGRTVVKLAVDLDRRYRAVPHAVRPVEDGGEG